MEYNKYIKEQFNSYYNYFKNKFQHNGAMPSNSDKENFQLVERKRKIFYFSKFTLDINEILHIYQTVRSIKENVLKNMIDSIKYCGNGNSRLILRCVKISKQRKRK
jgi:hypothetical protein